MSQTMWPYPSVNMMTVDAVSQRPVREVEGSIDTSLAELIYKRMKNGLFRI